MSVLATSAEMAVVANDKMPSKRMSRTHMFALGNASMLQCQNVFEAPAQRHLKEAQPLPCLLSNEGPTGQSTQPISAKANPNFRRKNVCASSALSSLGVQPSLACT